VSTTYDGSPHGTTATVNGVNGENLGPVTMTYNTGAGRSPRPPGASLRGPRRRHGRTKGTSPERA
jgi:hypothetical protein